MKSNSAALKPGEENDLRQERDRLANAENLASLAQQALNLLDEGGVEAPAATDLLGQIAQHLSGVERIDAGRRDSGRTSPHPGRVEH